MKRNMNYIALQVKELDQAKHVAGEWIAQFNQIPDDGSSEDEMVTVVIVPNNSGYIVKGFFESGTPFDDEAKSNAEDVQRFLSN